MNMKKQIIITALLLALTLLAEQFTHLDVILQNKFFDFNTCSWMLSRQNNLLLHFFFYNGAKIALIAAGAVAFIIFGASFESAKLRGYRYALLLFLSAMAIVPLVLAGAKKYTNVYCPAQLTLYCGTKPYAKLFESYPASFDRKANNKGRCFPAGHASGGFALMVLFFCLKKRRNKWLGLTSGVCAGWAMGFYQMLRGEHFLSHTVTSMFGAWLIILLLVLAMDAAKKKYPRFFAVKE